MPVTVIVGGQFGSEGKGKVAYDWAKRSNARVVIRVGGSNSGHTVLDNARKIWRFRHLPTACLLSSTLCVLPPGSYLDAEIVLAEIAAAQITSERLAIDPNAILITDRDKFEERATGLAESISSTCSGTGAAVVRRIGRNTNPCFAKDEPRLQQYIRPTAPLLRAALERRQRVLIEGTQGFGLSPLHSPFYPFVTSRDTTAAAFVSEAGLSPMDVDEVVLVIRAFPIRVSGAQAGPLPDEIDWATVTRESGYPIPVSEETTVTRKIRRVARFSAEIVRAAIQSNNPTHVVLNHLDYVDYLVSRSTLLTQRARQFVELVEKQIGRKIDLVGVGPDRLAETGHWAERRGVA